MVAMAFVWDIVMIPAWASQGQWGAPFVQLLVLIALPTMLVAIPYGLFWLAKHFIVGERVQYSQERR